MIEKYNLSYCSEEVISNFKYHLSKNYFSDKKLEIVCYRNAVVYPGIQRNPSGIVCEGKYVADSDLHCGRLPFSFDKVSAFKVEDRDEDVVFLGSFHNQWGHGITDVIKHLWFLGSGPASYREKKFVYVFIDVPSYRQKPLLKNLNDLLLSLGLDLSKCEEITKPTRFRNVYMPEPCFFARQDTKTGALHRYYTNEYLKMIENIVKHFDTGYSMGEKIYFSRTGVKSSDFGEKFVESKFKKAGYTVCHPENMTLQEQISAIRNSKIFAATAGSVAHNMLFSYGCGNDKGRINVILLKYNGINGYQLAIDQLSPGKVFLIDCFAPFFRSNKKNGWRGPFFIYPTKHLHSFLNVKSSFQFVSYLFALLLHFSRKITKKLPYDRLCLVKFRHKQ